MAVTSLTIITAQNPWGIRHTTARNYDLNRKLRLELQEGGADLVPINGKYAGNHENSFLVLDLPRSKALELQKRYKQQAIVWGFVRSVGFETPVIHWQYIEKGEAIGHQIQRVPKSIMESREDLLQGVKTGKWELPVFELDAEEKDSKPLMPAEPTDVAPWEA